MTEPAPSPRAPIGREALLDLGEAAPYFEAAALSGNRRYVFDSAAGRPILLLFLGSGRWAASAAALAVVARHESLFDDDNACFFGVTTDPDDAAQARIAQRIPGIRWFLDYDAAVSRMFGAAQNKDNKADYIPHWLLLDPMLRVVARAPINEGDNIVALLRDRIGRGVANNHAPVLTVPNIFEPDMCHQLIGLYDRHGGRDSGFMRQEGDRTVAKLDHNFKRRSDYTIEDEALKRALLDRITRRLLPQIHKAFQFRATRIERWIVACYDGESGGYFRPHRDNTTAGTAHRAFACTINLNAEEYDGGELRFPEFGPRTYRAPTGGAVIFSCSLLHEATAVTRGKRYAFLPFFYDEAGAALRERNHASLASATAPYRAVPLLAEEAPAPAVSRAKSRQ
ncbi:MAG TPA: 2OG-Fe(II) oxygenase [Sphingomonas sp.]|uniref:2OG-Fe(II) oxygenase family protein n=1 Tax=Sphingomonas sp. TaxID=28214 RepID=UPI002CEAC10B|nr:2OG-Fe(II) oxygenase [Sphingomonas sp.]HMI18770.1 2OG-Fe(II) oxygenase [Sphingomonas sp.]